MNKSESFLHFYITIYKHSAIKNKIECNNDNYHLSTMIYEVHLIKKHIIHTFSLICIYWKRDL